MLIYENCLYYVLYMHDMNLYRYIYDIVYAYIYVERQMNNICFIDSCNIVVMLYG